MTISKMLLWSSDNLILQDLSKSSCKYPSWQCLSLSTDLINGVLVRLKEGPERRFATYHKYKSRQVYFYIKIKANHM